MKQSQLVKFMLAAISAANQGIEKGQTPFGACVVMGGKIIARSHNQVWKRNDITAHAEILALRAACRRTHSLDLSGAVIFSTCEPCPMCFGACHWAKVSSIVYGARIADAKNYGFHELSIPSDAMRRLGKSRLRLIGPVLPEACVSLFAKWRSKAMSTAY